MGNIMKKNPGYDQTGQQQGGMFSFGQQQQQPVVQQQPQYVQQPHYAQQPVMQQRPQYVQQPQYAPQQPQYAPQQPAQYRPPMFPQQQQQQQQQQQGSYRPSYSGGANMPHYPAPPPLPLSNEHNPASYYENDAFLANLTGWSMQDIERLRHEFLSYANPYGVIDRDAFRKLYIASLLNMTWEVVEHDAETAFRNFDINQTGGLDFNEYITACSRMSRELNVPYPSSPPPISPSYTY